MSTRTTDIALPFQVGQCSTDCTKCICYHDAPHDDFLGLVHCIRIGRGHSNGRTVATQPRNTGHLYHPLIYNIGYIQQNNIFI